MSAADTPDKRALIPLTDRELAAVILAHAPDGGAVEEVFVNSNPQSTLKLGQARGVEVREHVRRGLLGRLTARVHPVAEPRRLGPQHRVERAGREVPPARLAAAGLRRCQLSSASAAAATSSRPQVGGWGDGPAAGRPLFTFCPVSRLISSKMIFPFFTPLISSQKKGGT